MVACSFFRGVQDNHPVPWIGSWERLAEGLLWVRKPKVGLVGDAAKKSLPALCAATFEPGTTRARGNVAGVHLLVLDFDNSAEESTEVRYSSGRMKMRKVPLMAPVSMEAICRQLQIVGVAAVAWTTWSAAAVWPKFRVVVPLVSAIPGVVWPQAAEWGLGVLGLTPFRAAIDIPVLHNAAALAFLPGALDSSSIRFFNLKGGPLLIPLDQLCAVQVPRHEPRAWEPRPSVAPRDDSWWKGYLVGGRPVSFADVDLAAILKRLGCKVGPERCWGPGIKRRCTCPWAAEHSAGVDDDAAVIFMESGKWPRFACSHSGHAGVGLREILEMAWGRP